MDTGISKKNLVFFFDHFYFLSVVDRRIYIYKMEKKKSLGSLALFCASVQPLAFITFYDLEQPKSLSGHREINLAINKFFSLVYADAFRSKNEGETL